MWHLTVAKQQAKPSCLKLVSISRVYKVVFQNLNALKSYPFQSYDTQVASSFSIET